MKLVQRANKQLRIPDEKLDYYLALGYHEVVLPAKPVEKPERRAKK